MSKRGVQHLFKTNILLAMIVVAAVLAVISPRLGSIDGPLAPSLTAGLIAPWLIYVSAGISIRPEELASNICKGKLITTILMTSLFAIPTFSMMCSAFGAGLSSWVWKGLGLMSCLPGSVTSSLVLVGCAHGNQAAAVVGGVVTNVAAVFISPMILLGVLGTTTSLPLYATLEMLFINTIAPFAVGQIVHLGGKWPRKFWLGAKMDKLSQLAFVFGNYISFCETFSTLRVDVSARTLLVTLGIVVMMQVASNTIIYIVTKRLQFAKGDGLAIMFCCGQKLTVLGIPMVRLLFSGLHHMDEVLLPLLLAGPVQAIVGTLAVSVLK